MRQDSGGASILIHIDIDIIENGALSLLSCNDVNIEIVFAEMIIMNFVIYLQQKWSILL